MKICVVGAGAIGGMLAARLAAEGHEVVAIARGPHLAAIRRQGGLRLIWSDGSEIFGALRGTDTLAEAGPQDSIILALKAHQLTPILADLPGVFHDDTSVVTMQNGLPFWYFQGHGGEFQGRVVESVDPGGAIAAAIPAERIVGSVVYPAAEIAEPGLIRHIEGNRFTLGAPDGIERDPIRAIAGALRGAGFKAPITADIRGEIWLKLWGNLTFNPLSALTRATLEDICTYPETRALAAAMMAEAQAIGERLGVTFKVSIDRRIAGAQAIGQHKTSMLQDLEAGRPLELDALVGSVIELGRVTGLPTPHIDAVHACVRLLDKTARTASRT